MTTWLYDRQAITCLPLLLYFTRTLLSYVLASHSADTHWKEMLCPYKGLSVAVIKYASQPECGCEFLSTDGKDRPGISISLSPLEKK